MQTLDANSVIEPICRLAMSSRPGVLAIITKIVGPFYRLLGAMMAVFDNKELVGTLSSGCIDSDIALHAVDTLDCGAPNTVIYGRGSPFSDIQLPCGAGLEITLIPRPDQTVMENIARLHKARQTAFCR